MHILYDRILQVRPSDPNWNERDRFILSKGHDCLALYTVLTEKSFFPREVLDSFCAFHSCLGGHPEGDLIHGVEATTASLGHGLSLGVAWPHA